MILSKKMADVFFFKNQLAPQLNFLVSLVSNTLMNIRSVYYKINWHQLKVGELVKLATFVGSPVSMTLCHADEKL
jgi:hypothetical protein